MEESEPQGSDEQGRNTCRQSDRNHDVANQRRELYILLENPNKGNNLGPILRCAAAFAVRKVVAVGYAKCSTDGSHGAAKHVEIVAFSTLDQAVSYLRNKCGCTLLVGLLGGAPDDNQARSFIAKEDAESETVQVSLLQEGFVEANRYSIPVHKMQPFLQGNCCIVISKRRGLPVPLATCCDQFVHVPHAEVLCDGNDNCRVALLDTQSCLSIALHHFTALAERDERTFQGHKFEVGRQGREMISSDGERDSKAAARLEAKQLAAQAIQDTIEDGALGNVFGGEIDGDY